MDSAMSMTPFSDIFMAARIHNIYPAKNNGLTLNMTLQLAENADTLRPPITGELSKHVQGVIHRRQNNVGNSALWVDNSPGVVSLVQDINECSSPELNDCSPAARCTNVFGSFQCTCPDTLFYSILSIFYSYSTLFYSYSISNLFFSDINECSSPELNDCSPAARFTNVFGSFQCTCPDTLFYSILSIFYSYSTLFYSYSISNLFFSDINECSSPELNDCSPAARCTNVFGSFQCTCPDTLFYSILSIFYSYSTLFYSYSCSILFFSDINECSSPELNDCSPAARCTNVFGSFQCTCPDTLFYSILSIFYSYSTLSYSNSCSILFFSDINECSSPELNDCSPAARCTNVFGSFQCTFYSYSCFILLRYQRVFLARTQRLFARGAMYQRVRLLPMYLPGYSILFYPYSNLFYYIHILLYSIHIHVLFYSSQISTSVPRPNSTTVRPRRDVPTCSAPSNVPSIHIHVLFFSDINECSSPELNDCSPAARCTNVFGSFQYINECSSPELNDCSPAARCTNVFGSFQCTCPEGTRDPWVGNLHQSGRTCESCDPSNCNHRGTCSYQTGQPVCKCSGSFYGAQCEIDGEVLGVAIGASVCALLIILVTLMCLCSWSRRWNREQKIGSPVFGYMPQGGSTVKTPAIGGPPYQVSLEDRLRWAQIADAMAHANHYAPEPVVGTMNSTRPSSAMFGYSLPHHPVPLPRLRPPASQLRTPESSTSEEEDRTDLLGRNFQVPRPKSRSSVANQSGIYYDVDYEQQNDVFSQKSHPSCIPLNTYTMGSRLARPSKLTRLARPSKLTRLARPSKLTRLARPSKLTRLARPYKLTRLARPSKLTRLARPSKIGYLLQ
ncbi:hypothetical protein M8J76_002729 [Diaphorina citri]|nr:hypothetical protein M8J76_002729 [Diaphorina citri]